MGFADDHVSGFSAISGEFRREEDESKYGVRSSLVCVVIVSFLT